LQITEGQILQSGMQITGKIMQAYDLKNKHSSFFTRQLSLLFILISVFAKFLPLQPKFPLFLFGQPGISAQLFTHSERKQTQIFSEISGNNDKTSFPLARLISHILCYILSYESFK